MSPSSGSLLFAVSALPENSFVQPQWFTAVSCRGLGGGGRRDSQSQVFCLRN